MIRNLSILILSLAAVAAAEGEMSRTANRLLDSARRMARASRFGERQEELLEKKMDGVEPDDLGRVIDALRADPKPGKSRDGVLAYLERRYLTAKYGELAAEKLDGLYALRASKDPEKVVGLLTAALMLPDFRLANELAVGHARSTDGEVRLRVAIAISDLIAFRGADPAAEKAFTELLADADPAVRAVAIRRAFEVRFDPAFDLALASLNDARKATAIVRGEGEELCPGAEALRALTELTWIEREMTYGAYRKAEVAEKKALVSELRAWWEKWGSFFPAPGHHEAVFKKRPSSTKSIVIPRNETTATFNFWSAKDRTRIRVHLDEVQLVATSLSDWRVNFHVRYMSSGMRPDDGEAYPRHLFTGTPFVLARKKIGCYVFVFQRRLDGTLSVTLDFHDPDR